MAPELGGGGTHVVSLCKTERMRVCALPEVPVTSIVRIWARVVKERRMVRARLGVSGLSGMVMGVKSRHGAI